MSGALRGVGLAYLTVLMLFVLGPAAIIAVDSVNSATSFPSPFEHATLHWYAALGDHPEFLAAAWTSLEVAAIAAVAATIAGFLAAYALARRLIPGRDAITTAMMGPLLIPEIVTGLAILQVVGLMQLPLGLVVLAGAHAVFVLPLALRLAQSGFSRFDFALEDAARSLGAGRARTVWLVTLPLLRPSLLGGFILSLIMSFVNLPLSMFLATAQTSTLPVMAFAYMESRIDPMIAALATLVMLFATAAAIVVDRVLRLRPLR